jgi:acyl-coenzyme A synthetase/AMP-(fatty) acid ligase/acyl carrier protein
MEAGGSVPLHSSISFDLTVTSLYAPLLAGGSVELLAEGSAAQSLLLALRRNKGRTLVKITPAHLELLSNQLGSEEVADMTRTFVIGGENLLAEKLRLWREFAPATRLINEYGPTETAVGCCVYEVQADDPCNGSVPIGRPIDNTRLYVLDPNLQPVPLGEAGELYIGGAGVARGYWNRPELTEERFLPDPFSGQPEARLYKSGDLARYRQDGILEYLGRADDQVKVRGYRIELGEIEAMLASHPGVREAAVSVREDAAGAKRLVAYVVPPPVAGQASRSDELREFLARKLPDYMIPADFVRMTALPLTANGKLDRTALPIPARENALDAIAYRAPQSPIEIQVASIVSQLLALDRVGSEDNFFLLGLHSLLSAMLIMRLRERFGVQLTLRDLFETHTVAKLAVRVERELISGLEQMSEEEAIRILSMLERA